MRSRTAGLPVFVETEGIRHTPETVEHEMVHGPVSKPCRPASELADITQIQRPDAIAKRDKDHAIVVSDPGLKGRPSFPTPPLSPLCRVVMRIRVWALEKHGRVNRRLQSTMQRRLYLSISCQRHVGKLVGMAGFEPTAP